jgi:hypothetical protein
MGCYRALPLQRIYPGEIEIGSSNPAMIITLFLAIPITLQGDMGRQ